MLKIIVMCLIVLTVAILGIDRSRADVYVITDPNNNIYSLSEQNDAQMPKGYTRTVLRNQKISNLPITGDGSLYTFKGGAFTVNATAVQAQQTAQAQSLAAQQAAAAAKASAIAKLTDAISKVNTADVLTNQELNSLLSS